jgi:hypothetical protein
MLGARPSNANSEADSSGLDPVIFLCLNMSQSDARVGPAHDISRK